MFVSHESDILWILYQVRNGRPARYVRRILGFLDLEWPDGFAELVPQLIHHRDPNEKYASFALPEVRGRRG